ncbi:craniofacial development protein 1-like [Babylonia areolata]|uniref:craniofacial development protein 1-like n=1 Tax=Babylonia areolata TaxID=304850 RepID=UPI003FD313FA
MSDEEDYNSEEDADYVPSDGELGSEEENSGDEEDLSVLADDAGTATHPGTKKTSKRKQKKNDFAPRKRKGGIQLEEGEEAPAEETNGDTQNTELAQRIKEEEEQKKKEKEKKRADDLWSSFLTDVKTTTKPSPKVAPASTTVKQPVSSSPAPDAPQTTCPPPTAPPPASPVSSSTADAGKVTITKVFDFAGEEIKITKEVAADSKEAKAELKKREQLEQHKAAPTPTPTTPKPTSSLLTTNSSPSPSSLSAGPGLLGVKRPTPGAGGLGNVLSKIGKKQKMGTLEKSKMDWEAFKQKEGINEDLKIHNKGKDGYIERMSFLNRTDVRQFEIERDLRLSKSGKR